MMSLSTAPPASEGSDYSRPPRRPSSWCSCLDSFRDLRRFLLLGTKSNALSCAASSEDAGTQQQQLAEKGPLGGGVPSPTGA